MMLQECGNCKHWREVAIGHGDGVCWFHDPMTGPELPRIQTARFAVAVSIVPHVLRSDSRREWEALEGGA